MLSPANEEIVRATLPVVQQHLPAITGVFCQPDGLPLHPDTEAYLCGLVPFMQAIRTSLRQRGLPVESTRCEVFGADQWTPTRAA
jgi:ferredoxin-NADP reductase